MWVVVIAVLHGLFVTYAAHKFSSKIITVLAAIISAIVGVATGNPAYMGADFVGVAIGLWIGIGIMEEQPAKAPKPVAVVVSAAHAATPKNEGVGWVIVATLIAGLFFYNFLKDTRPPTKPTPQPTPRVNAPVTAPPARYPDAANTQHSNNKVQKAKKPKKTALQRCLEIRSDEKMAACLAGLDG